jgi:hypothetical protein
LKRGEQLKNPIVIQQESIKKMKKMIVILGAIIIATVYGAKMYIDAYYVDIKNENERVTKLNEETQKKFKSLNDDLINQKKMIQKYNIREKVISMYIQEKNPNVSISSAKTMAVAIIITSNRYPNNVKHTVLTGLAESESTFNTKVQHLAKSSTHIDVTGVCGISTKVWSKELIAAKVIRCKEDLKNPTYNIASAGYILNKYAQGRSTLAALTDYKSRCDLGRRQAKDVLKKAENVKLKEQRYA